MFANSKPQLIFLLSTFSIAKLTGQLQFATIPLGEKVVVEEIGVESGLDDARDPADPVAIAGLDNEAPDPIQNVEGAI